METRKRSQLEIETDVDETTKRFRLDTQECFKMEIRKRSHFEDMDETDNPTKRFKLDTHELETLQREKAVLIYEVEQLKLFKSNLECEIIKLKGETQIQQSVLEYLTNEILKISNLEIPRWINSFG